MSSPNLNPGLNPTLEVHADVELRLAGFVRQLEAFLQALQAIGEPLALFVGATAGSPDSATSKMSSALGAVLRVWARLVEGHGDQVTRLLPPRVLEVHSQLLEAQARVTELESQVGASLATLEGLKLANDTFLLERLNGISVKVGAVADKCSRALAAAAPATTSSTRGPAAAPSTSTTVAPIAPGVKGVPTKGKKRPAIAATSSAPQQQEPPAKRQASDKETQRVQGPFSPPSNMDWADITAIGPLMQACGGLIAPEAALALTKAFEFRPRTNKTNTPMPFAASVAAPRLDASAVTPPAPSTAPQSVQASAPQPRPKPKPAPPVVHVPAPRDPTKILRVVFSAPVSDLSHRRELVDVQSWVREQLQRIEAEPNEVVDFTWHVGGVHADIRFQSRPSDATRVHLNQTAEWFAYAPGAPRGATVDFYTPITRIAIRALRAHRAGTHEDLEIEEICAAIMGENPWLAENLLSYIQSPKPHWVDKDGGSGTFVFSVYDNRDGTASAGWCKKKLRVFGAEHYISRYDVTPRIPLCSKCWHWQHTASTCKAGKVFCSKCSYPHVDADHPRFCTHEECKKVRLQTLEPRTLCTHVYCANCDSLEHSPSARECPFNRHASNKDAKAWFSKNQPEFSAQAMRAQGKFYDGERAVEDEKRRRAAVDEVDDAPGSDDGMEA